MLQRLWQLFRHDLSEFRGDLPGPDGRYRTERIDAVGTDPDRLAHLLRAGQHPVGLALVRGLTGPERVLSGFFVVRGYRRRGVGLAAVRQVVERHPGPWWVPFQEENPAAAGFWRRVATELAGDAWTLERRPVPDRPDLPPDSWIGWGRPAA